MAETSNIVTPNTGVIPHLAIRDGVGAMEFYQAAFAAEEMSRVYAQDGKRLMHATLRINGGPLMLNDFFEEFGHKTVEPQTIALHLQVDDVDAWWKRAVDAGCSVAMPLEKQFWGDRYGHLTDPFGVRWSLAQTAG
jgi:PhnB protein